MSICCHATGDFDSHSHQYGFCLLFLFCVYSHNLFIYELRVSLIPMSAARSGTRHNLERNAKSKAHSSVTALSLWVATSGKSKAEYFNGACLFSKAKVCDACMTVWYGALLCVGVQKRGLSLSPSARGCGCIEIVDNCNDRSTLLAKYEFGIILCNKWVIQWVISRQCVNEKRVKAWYHSGFF